MLTSERLRGLLRRLPGRLPDAIGVVRHAVPRFWNNNGFAIAASLTYTTLLALVPLLTVTFAIFSAFPAYGRLRDTARALIFDSLAPSVSDEVQAYFDQFISNAAALTGFGVIGLSITSILLFFSVEAALNVIFRATEPRPLVIRLLSFWAVLTIMPLLLGASLSVTSGVVADLQVTGRDAVTVLRFMLPGLLEAAAFTLMYLMIPNREVQWFDALVGGVAASVLMEVSKIGFGLYIATFPTYETIYGALSVIPIFLFWLYTVWTVVLFGAEITATLPEWRAGKITQVGPEGLLSAQRIVVAVAILHELQRAARLGVGVRRGTLATRVPVGANIIDGMLEQLQAAHWVARTRAGAWVATRNLSDATVDDLRHSLGMAIRGNLRSVGHLRAPWQDRLADLFDRAEAADREVLDVCFADLFADPPAGQIEAAGRLPRRAAPPGRG